MWAPKKILVIIGLYGHVDTPFHFLDISIYIIIFKVSIQSFHTYTFESFRAIKNFQDHMTYLLTLKPISFIMPGHNQHINCMWIFQSFDAIFNKQFSFSSKKKKKNQTNSFLFSFFPSWHAANLKLFLLLLKEKFKEYSRRKVQNRTKKTFIIIIYISPVKPTHQIR